MVRLFLPLFAAITLTACSKPNEGPGSTATAAATSRATTSAPASAPSSHEHHPHGDATAQPHQDHNARYGGVLTMEGDSHVEIVVAKDGAIDLYVSDAIRKPIPVKDISGTITLGSAGKKEKQTLTLSEDPAKGSLSAKGPAPDNTEYTWSLKVRGAPMTMTLQVPSGGTGEIDKGSPKHPAGAHKHGSPHGGVVQTLGDGHIEVKLEKTGEVTAWMLDSAEKPRSAKGTVASIRPVVAGSKEVKLEYDEKSDTLRGKVDPVAQEHVDAVLSVTPAGGTATSLRFAFHLEAHAGHVGH
jgi:hypothetical protein